MIISKYNGLGNDFVMMAYDPMQDYSALAKQLCALPEFDTDGLIAVKTGPLEMIYYNRDGSRASMCGNGIRCFAKYVLDHELTDSRKFLVETLAGTMQIEVDSLVPFHCQVNMGAPLYSNELMGLPETVALDEFKIALSDTTLTASSVFMGTVHTVVFVDDALAELSTQHGTEICHHALFANQTNVNFVQVKNEHELIVRTFERGVGWTQACGTGCCASYVIARGQKKIAAGPATIHLELGDLIISGTDHILMAGPAKKEFEKEVAL